jgi:pseudaminic acid cytidylyltransferase
MKICVIPARGGSKRIPRKNIRNFCGKPMLAWAIGHALQSELFDKVIVSTDDKDVADVARAAGAETPFLRPAVLPDDLTPTAPVIAHAVEACLEIGWCIEYACCIYPCVPFLETSDLTAAFRLLQRYDTSFVYPVTDYDHPIQRAMRRLPTGQMQLLQPEHELTRTQDLEKTYHDTGQFYWARASSWTAYTMVHSAGTGLIVPNWRVFDIDNDDDWKRAELLYKAINN